MFLWISWCLRRWPFCVNDFPQISQLYGFSPVWTRSCSARLEGALNDLLQNRQKYPLLFLGDRVSGIKTENKAKKMSKIYISTNRRDFFAVDHSLSESRTLHMVAFCFPTEGCTVILFVRCRWSPTSSRMRLSGITWYLDSKCGHSSYQLWMDNMYLWDIRGLILVLVNLFLTAVLKLGSS